jgi:hypothetical protein
MTFWEDNGTKVLGYTTALFGTLGTLVTTGAFEGLLSPAGVRWLAIICAVAGAMLGGATVTRGHTNSTAEKVATVIDNALKATPGEASK